MLPVETKRWDVGAPIPEEIDTALAVFPPLFRQVLFNRGIHTAEDARIFLDAAAPPYSPLLLKGMAETVERVLYAADNAEKVAIYGDYDVDGVTATALLVEVLTCLGVDVSSHIPNRFEEGYGLNNDALTALNAQGVDLVITVDCGIRSPAEAEHARTLGMDLIISDHHHPGSQIPHAAAVICPSQEGDSYPDKNLSGVGLAYKIAAALLEARPLPDHRAEDWLDLVALGTVADVVPLRGENRALVRAGLKRLSSSQRSGVVSLAGVAGVKLPIVSANDIGFFLGPRLNAAGRLDSAMAALKLLTEKNILVTGMLAQQLDSQNRERQSQTREMQLHAADMTREAPAGEIVFAFAETFNSGIVGLVAARLMETFYRPAVVGCIEGDTARASCRSIPEFHITHALDECKDLLVRHGGHSVAAGFTVRMENLAELQQRLATLADQQLAGKELIPILKADAEVDLSSLRAEDIFKLITFLDGLQPTGQANPDAAFVSRGLRVVRSRTVGADSQHLKLSLSDGRMTWDAIAFRQGRWHATMPARIDILYAFERNLFNGNVTLQLNVRDLKPSA